MRQPYQQELDWYGLYQGDTSRDDILFTRESVAHPAKMSLPLLVKILETMRAFGWLETGDCVVDPFGGRGTTAAVWCGLHPANRAVTVELERHFVEMQHANKAHAETRLGRPLWWTILQGDSRRVDELLREAGVGVTSPPYSTEFARTHNGNRGGTRGTTPSEPGAFVRYGDTAGQIEGLPDPIVDRVGAVLSPPYGQGTIGKTDAEKLRALTQDPTSSLYGRDPNGAWFQAMATGYVNSPGNIDNLRDERDPAAVLSPPYEGDQPCQSQSRAMKDYHAFTRGNGTKRDPIIGCTSPPYEQSIHSGNGIDASKLSGNPPGPNTQARAEGYDTAAVTSPPFEGVVATADPNFLTPGEREKKVPSKSNLPDYGDSAAQIGATQGEIYAGAVFQVYAALARAGVRYLAVVTKNPTRDGKLRRLDKLTARLLRAAGYRVRGWRRAHLFEEARAQQERLGQASLFGEEDAPAGTRYVGRLSFFRRLHLAKGGVAASYEDIFFAELAE